MKHENYVGSVEFVETPKEITEESLAEYIAKLAGVVYDKDVKNPMKRFKALQSEAYGSSPSRMLEYIPCKIESRQGVVDIANSTLRNDGQLFGFFKDKTYYTNMRELLNWNWKVEWILEAVDFTDYKAFRCETPYMVYKILNTHSQLTTIPHSQKYTETDIGYWMPPGVYEVQETWNRNAQNWSKLDLSNYMKACGISRKEIYDCGFDSLQIKPFSIGGYTSNDNSWKWLLNKQSSKRAQPEIRDFVQLFKKEI